MTKSERNPKPECPNTPSCAIEIVARRAKFSSSSSSSSSSWEGRQSRTRTRRRTRRIWSNFREAGLKVAEAAGHVQVNAVLQQDRVLARPEGLDLANSSQVHDD